MRAFLIATALILMPAIASAQSASETNANPGFGSGGMSATTKAPAHVYGPPAPVPKPVSSPAAPTASPKSTTTDDSQPAPRKHRGGHHRGGYAGMDAGGMQ